MAKKKKKYLIKLNNTIRNYFNGLPFDEGIDTIDDDKLIELIMLLELTLPSHEHDDMVRALRRVWSEEGAGIRELIVSYLTQSYKAVHHGKTKQPLDKVEKILQLLEDIEHSKHEENLLLEAFIDVKSSKVTSEKIRSKLHYLRMKDRLSLLEKSLSIEFTTLNEMQFTHSFTFALKNFDFTKLLLCTTNPLPMDELWEENDDKIIVELERIKEKTVEVKILEIESFLEHINGQKHPYLSEEEVTAALKRMPLDVSLYHAPVALNIIEGILINISDKYDVFESTDHIIIEKEKNHNLFGTMLYYNTSVSCLLYTSPSPRDS